MFTRIILTQCAQNRTRGSNKQQRSHINNNNNGGGGHRSRSRSVLDELQSAFPSNSELLANISRVMACLEEDAIINNNNNHQNQNNKSHHQQQQQPQQQQPQQQPQQQQPTASSRYKTELCRPFEENGHCKYGDKCQFAHGHDELRSMSRHPKYKTEPCRTFHTTGICPYGPRCHFIHSTSKDRSSPSNAPPAPFSRPKGLSLSSVSSTASSDLSSLNSDSGSIGSHSPSSLSSSPTFHDDDYFSGRSASHFFTSGYGAMRMPNSIGGHEVDPLDELAYTLSACKLSLASAYGNRSDSVPSADHPLSAFTGNALISSQPMNSPLVDLSRGLHLPGVFGSSPPSFGDLF